MDLNETFLDEIVNGNLPPMALRLSGQILLGASRIYWRKARYLLEDCNETLDRLKLNFKTDAQVDLPQEHSRAPLASITLASNFSTAAATNLLLPEPELDLDEILNMVATQPAPAAANSNNLMKEKFNLGKATGNPQGADSNDSLLQAFPMSEDFEIETGRRLTDLSGMNMSRDTNPFVNRDSPATFKLEDIEMGRRESMASAATAMSPMRLPSTPGKDTTLAMMDDGDLMWDSPAAAVDSASPLPAAPFNTPPKPRATAANKKRKVALDEVTELSSSQIQRQVKDTSDILLGGAGSKQGKRGKSSSSANAHGSGAASFHAADAAAAANELRRISLAEGESEAAALLARPVFEGDLIMDTFGDLFRSNPLSQLRREEAEKSAANASVSGDIAKESELGAIAGENVTTAADNASVSGFMPVDNDFMDDAPSAVFETSGSGNNASSGPITLDIAAAVESSAGAAVTLQSIISGQTRSTAAKAFFDVLAGAARGQWAVQQPSPFGIISLSQH